jgi:hypothetical protein
MTEVLSTVSACGCQWHALVIVSVWWVGGWVAELAEGLAGGACVFVWVAGIH